MAKTMTAADYFTAALIAQFVVAAIAYACEGNWPRVLYFGGSAILTLGVLLK